MDSPPPPALTPAQQALYDALQRSGYLTIRFSQTDLTAAMAGLVRHGLAREVGRTALAAAYEPVGVSERPSPETPRPEETSLPRLAGGRGRTASHRRRMAQLAA